MGLLLDQLKITNNKIYTNLAPIDLDRRSQRRRNNNDYSLKNMLRSTHHSEEEPRSKQRHRRVLIHRNATLYMVKLRYKKRKTLSLKLKPEPKAQAQELPYRGILGFPDCTINNTDPTTEDRIAFENFREEGEKLKEKEEEQYGILSTASTVSSIVFRDFVIETWYTAPYPEEYSQLKTLYICEHCLKYMNLPISYHRHQLKYCNLSNSHPPGVEIYRDPINKVAVWEVDGRKNITYCQNLCLLAKLFLNLKTLYYDVEPFIFYVLSEIDSANKYHFVGYFSKEKLNSSDYNVSCILTLPIYQRKGYGSFLIEFSYLLSRNEFKFGTPEKPLSDLGLLSYRNYWKVTVATTLKMLHDKYQDKQVSLSIETLSKLTGMTPLDVVVGLEQLHALRKKPNSSTYAIVADLHHIDHVITKWNAKNYVLVNPTLLLWKPMLFGPSGGINSVNTLTKSDYNSISLISGFLMDDIKNPYTFEEEAHMEIEEYSNAVEVNDFEVCQLGVPSLKKSVPIKLTQEVKESIPDTSGDEAATNEVEESDFDEVWSEDLDAEEGIALGSDEDEDEIDENDDEDNEEALETEETLEESEVEVATRRSTRIKTRTPEPVQRPKRLRNAYTN